MTIEKLQEKARLNEDFHLLGLLESVRMDNYKFQNGEEFLLQDKKRYYAAKAEISCILARYSSGIQDNALRERFYRKHFAAKKMLDGLNGVSLSESSVRGKSTPIEYIFCENPTSLNYDHSVSPCLIERVVVFCENYKITTAEQLATISEQSFRKMALRMGLKIGKLKERYVFNRMRDMGFQMPNKRVMSGSAFEVIGKNALKDYLVAKMTDVPRLKGDILTDAHRDLKSCLMGHLFDVLRWSNSKHVMRRVSLYKDREFVNYKDSRIEQFVDGAFFSPKIASLFDELVEEGRVFVKSKVRHSGYYIPKRIEQ